MSRNPKRLWRGFLLGVLAVLAGCHDNDAATGALVNRVWGAADPGLVDGAATVARFSNPVNVAVAADGTVYVADFDNDALRVISAVGVVSTLVKQSSFSRPRRASS